MSVQKDIQSRVVPYTRLYNSTYGIHVMSQTRTRHREKQRESSRTDARDTRAGIGDEQSEYWNIASFGDQLIVIEASVGIAQRCNRATLLMISLPPMCCCPKHARKVP